MNKTITTSEALALCVSNDSFSVVADPEAYDLAMTLTRGEYQHNVLAGVEALSGSTLTGKAARYGSRYAESRRNLLARMTAAGIAHGQVRAAKGKRVLVIGAVVV